jgi:exodeoxyribonuclease-3
MKIVTWNINSVRLRLSLLKKLIEEQQPDVICLQEIKVEDLLFPHGSISELGYKYLYYSGQKSYHGVAILSKIQATDNFIVEFYNEDKRHIAVKIKDIEIHNFYIPAGGDIPDINENPKFKHKLGYIDLAQNWFTTNRSKQDKIIVLGDLNIAPHEHDVWSSKQLKNVVSHTGIEREKLINFQNSLEFIDSARHFTPMSQKLYTWWSYRNQDWMKSDRGRRLDHIWVSANLKSRMKSINSLKDARSWTQPSDHVPYILELHE